MRPIRKELLVNTITVLNYYKNDDGDKEYIASVIKRCLAWNKENKFLAQSYGANKQYSWNVIFDNKNTYCEGKRYIDYKQWQQLSDYDKESYWTLQVDDVVINGVYDPDESIDEDSFEQFVIKDKVEYQDKDGSIHSRQILCV